MSEHKPGGVMTNKYAWEQIPKGETPEWGEWIRMEGWGDADQFVGVDPSNPDRWVTQGGYGSLTAYYANSVWLRRVEAPPKWEKKWIVCDERGLDGLCEGEHVSGHRLARVWCDQDDELHVEWS